MNPVKAVEFIDDQLLIMDQTLLPNEEVYIVHNTAEQIFDSIYKLKVRGAPAIGVAAAYGIYVSTRNLETSSFDQFAHEFSQVKNYLASSRPTAVNLFWALDRMDQRLKAMGQWAGVDGSKWPEMWPQVREGLLEEAKAIHSEDQQSCLGMAQLGLELLKPGMTILTHCNAGALATGGIGTCLGPIYLGQQKGYNFKVYADETRPLLQGARLTSWELSKAGVDVTLICDNMAASVMKKGLVDAVVVGCDRLAANGDGANKIGTLSLAILAKEYGIPFYMFVPTSTIDMDLPSGDQIPIELRDGEEIKSGWYQLPMAPDLAKTYNPAFDVTDSKYITAIVTEKAIVGPPYTESLKRLMK